MQGYFNNVSEYLRIGPPLYFVVKNYNYRYHTVIHVHCFLIYHEYFQTTYERLVLESSQYVYRRTGSGVLEVAADTLARITYNHSDENFTIYDVPQHFICFSMYKPKSGYLERELLFFLEIASHVTFSNQTVLYGVMWSSIVILDGKFFLCKHLS